MYIPFHVFITDFESDCPHLLPLFSPDNFRPVECTLTGHNVLCASYDSNIFTYEINFIYPFIGFFIFTPTLNSRWRSEITRMNGLFIFICGLFRDITIIGRSVVANVGSWNRMYLEGSGRDPVELSSLKFLGLIKEYHKIRQYNRCLYYISKHTPPEDNSPITLLIYEPARWKPSGWHVLSSYKGGLIALIKLQLSYAWIVAY